MARKELYLTRKTTFTAEGITGERKFYCLWDERLAVKPNIGEPYPDFPGLYCSSVEIEGTGQTTDTGGHTHAFITAQYTTLDRAKQQQTGATVNRSLQFGGEMLTRAGGKWKDCKQDIPADGIGGQFFPRVEYTHEMTVSSITEWVKKLLKAVGSVNSSSWLGAEPGTWLFQGATARDFVDDNGAKKWSLDFSFVYNPIGWQKQWHKECPTDQKGNINFSVARGRWEEVLYVKENGIQYTEKMYAEYDFNKIVDTRKA